MVKSTLYRLGIVGRRWVAAGVAIIAMSLAFHPAVLADHLNFSSRGVSFNGKLLQFPATRGEVIAVFGEPSGTDYVSPDDKIGSNVLEWSHIGVYAYQRPATGLIYAIGVSISDAYPERNFEKAFDGRISVRLAKLRLTRKGITRSGFSRTSIWANWRRTLGKYYMTVITETPNDPRELEFGLPPS